MRYKISQVCGIDFSSEASLRNAAKNVIMHSLQRTRFGLTNTTNSGLKIRALLNHGDYRDLKDLLFPPTCAKLPQEPVTYHGLRSLIVTDNVHKVFSSGNQGGMWTLFEKMTINSLVSDEAMEEALTTRPK